jgi:O-6-methylguanine DNA methyltransferase
MPRSESTAARRPLIGVGIDTPAGKFIAFYSQHGLAMLEFPRRYAQVPALDPAQLSAPLREWIAFTQEALLALLQGEPARALPPLDLSAGTEFQQRVWSALCRIPQGQTKSYGEIAAEIGSPKAVRAVGGACGANPIPVLIPCHRVLAAGRDIGGFSAGLDWKLRLLAAERILS